MAFGNEALCALIAMEIWIWTEVPVGAVVGKGLAVIQDEALQPVARLQVVRGPWMPFKRPSPATSTPRQISGSPGSGEVAWNS